MTRLSNNSSNINIFNKKKTDHEKVFKVVNIKPVQYTMLTMNTPAHLKGKGGE